MNSEAAPLREPRSREPPRSRRVRAAALSLVLGSLGLGAVVATRAATGTRDVADMKQEERSCWMEYRAKNGNGYKLKKKRIDCDCGGETNGGGGGDGGSNPPVPSDDPQLPYFDDFEEDVQQPYAD